jgi:hypothetical protein
LIFEKNAESLAEEGATVLERPWPCANKGPRPSAVPAARPAAVLRKLRRDEIDLREEGCNEEDDEEP